MARASVRVYSASPTTGRIVDSSRVIFSIVFLLYANEFVRAGFRYSFCPHFRPNLAGNGKALAPVRRDVVFCGQKGHRSYTTRRCGRAPSGCRLKKRIIATSGPSSTLCFRRRLNFGWLESQGFPTSEEFSLIDIDGLPLIGVTSFSNHVRSRSVPSIVLLGFSTRCVSISDTTDMLKHRLSGDGSGHVWYSALLRAPRSL